MKDEAEITTLYDGQIWSRSAWAAIDGEFRRVAVAFHAFSGGHILYSCIGDYGVWVLPYDVQENWAEASGEPEVSELALPPGSKVEQGERTFQAAQNLSFLQMPVLQAEG